MSEFRKLLDEINKLNTDEEIIEFVKKRFDYLEQNSETRKISNYNYEYNNFFGSTVEGYINSKSSITTSHMVDPFYMDDTNIYVEFIKKIKGKDLSNLLAMFYELQNFTSELFDFKGVQSNREKIYMVERDSNISITDFYHNKSALCSERSATVHNLAEFLGIKSYLVIGDLEVDNKEEAHVFIIFQAQDGTLILYDPTNPIILNYEGNVSYAPAFSIIGKQNIDDLEEIDFDFKTIETIHKKSIDEDEKPRKYFTYKYKLNKRK